ncbi:hypothetical protein EON64_20935 [archaeon]|nr:MAG: hypothetical protein EON64_20935 [archaeon]
MADEFLRSKLYEYGANSNLVLEAERDGSRRKDAGKGEVETLRGRTNTFRMGDKLVGTKQPNDMSAPPAKRHKAEDSRQIGKSGRGLAGGVKGLSETQEDEGYVPKSAETRVAFEQLLVEVRGLLGDLPHQALRSAASDVLSVLKSAALRSA